MTTAHLQSVLLDADGPLVVVLRDALDGAWVGTAIERGEEGDEYFCVPVSPSRLSRFRHGELDLRTVLREPEEGRSAKAFIPLNGKAKVAILELVPVLVPLDDWFPDPGFVLTTFIEPVESEFREMASLATAENRPILRLNLSPPDGSHAIDIERLGNALVLFQNGVRHAHALVTRSLKPAEKKRQSAPENHIFEAVAFAPNSFEVHMRAKGDPNIFGETPHMQALAKLDEITSVVDDTEAAMAVAKENRGHFVSAVTALMKFIATTKVPLSYAWTAPQSSRVYAHVIRPVSAEALYEALIQKADLSQEDVTLIGILKKLDVPNRAWTLMTPEGEEYRGGVATDREVSISNLNVDGALYRLHCRDVLNETAGSGRQASRLELLARPEELKPAP